jgi:hypothetical protein
MRVSACTATAVDGGVDGIVVVNRTIIDISDNTDANPFEVRGGKVIAEDGIVIYDPAIGTIQPRPALRREWRPLPIIFQVFLF